MNEPSSYKDNPPVDHRKVATAEVIENLYRISWRCSDLFRDGCIKCDTVHQEEHKEQLRKFLNKGPNFPPKILNCNRFDNYGDAIRAFEEECEDDSMTIEEWLYMEATEVNNE